MDNNYNIYMDNNNYSNSKPKTSTWTKRWPLKFTLILIATLISRMKNGTLQLICK
jgi:hypothetical protein